MVDAKKARSQLGIGPGAARNKLIKNLLFEFAKKCGQDVCIRCGKRIESVDVFSIDHIEPWLDSDNPKGLYFDTGNIGYSHHLCNTAAARCPHKKYFTKKERLEADRRITRDRMKRNYTTENRRKKYRETGW